MRWCLTERPGEARGKVKGYTTARCRVEPLAAGDRALFTAIYTDADLMRHVGPALAPSRAAAAFDAALAAHADAARDDAYWVVRSVQPGADAGLLGLQCSDGVGRVGMLLLPDWQDRGIATEVIDELGRQAARRTRLRALCIEYRETHAQAAGLMRKLGYRLAAPGAGPEGFAQWWFDLPVRS